MKRVRYDAYRFSATEWIRYTAIGFAIAGITAYLFYRSIIAFLLLSVLVPYYMKRKKQQLLEMQKRELSIQFREAIMSVSASLGAGYSIENSFIEAGKDLQKFYGEDAVILREFSLIAGRLSANDTLESILQDFADRSGLEDIQDFTDVFVTAKQSGGDMTAIIRRSVDQIGEKIEVSREINTLMSAKRLEQNIMNVIPFGIIFYVSVNSPGFLDALYHNLTGVVIMTGCLVLYAGAFLLSEKIVSIEV